MAKYIKITKSSNRELGPWAMDVIKGVIQEDSSSDLHLTNAPIILF